MKMIYPVILSDCYFSNPEFSPQIINRGAAEKNLVFATTLTQRKGEDGTIADERLLPVSTLPRETKDGVTRGRKLITQINCSGGGSHTSRCLASESNAKGNDGRWWWRRQEGGWGGPLLLLAR